MNGGVFNVIKQTKTIFIILGSQNKLLNKKLQSLNSEYNKYYWDCLILRNKTLTT